MAVETTVENGLLVVTVTERWTKEKATAVQAEAARLLAGKPVRGMLIDVRAGRLDGSTLDAFDVITAHLQQLPTALRIAGVLSAEDAVLPTARFAENVAYNRGIPLRVFTEVQSAKDWLLERETP